MDHEGLDGVGDPGERLSPRGDGAGLDRGAGGIGPAGQEIVGAGEERGGELRRLGQGAIDDGLVIAGHEPARMIRRHNAKWREMAREKIMSRRDVVNRRRAGRMEDGLERRIGGLGRAQRGAADLPGFGQRQEAGEGSEEIVSRESVEIGEAGRLKIERRRGRPAQWPVCVAINFQFGSREPVGRAKVQRSTMLTVLSGSPSISLPSLSCVALIRLDMRRSVICMSPSRTAASKTPTLSIDTTLVISDSPRSARAS